MIYVGAISLGCAKNRVDTEIMLGLLGQAGYGITADPQRADLLLVNTCAFITPAARESIKAVLEAGRYKQEGCLKAVVVTGCLVQRYGAALVREMPEIDAVLGTGEIGKVALAAKQALQGKKPVVIGSPGFVNTIEPR
ncbi:MAG: 30S ribosomal protein S12 methylthiotransferase RimO, partial [Firmicutes bacterium]|nr:30S ribosomal protein S12 methylthiotransferase RimO [Bacillota bacterium]